jgi:hypothetical protein
LDGIQQLEYMVEELNTFCDDEPESSLELSPSEWELRAPAVSL